MKFIVLATLFICSSAFAGIIKSEKIQLNAARIDKLVTLVDKPGIRVNLVVEDTGGSTDFSPTKNLYFTLYRKGEMFDVDAVFNLGPAFRLVSATRLSGGIYQVKADVLDTNGNLRKVTLRIDAVKAINAIKAVNCGDEFECAAAEKFASEITVE